MSTPLGALWRIVVPYTTDGLLHATHVYARNGQIVGGTYNINTRATDSNDLDWVDAADGLALLLNPILPTSTTYGSALLQEIVGFTWITRAAHALTDATAGSSVLPCEQDTVVLRDLLFNKVRFVVMEGVFGTPKHWTDINTPGGAATAFMRQFTPDATLTHPPYAWMVGRSNQYLSTSPFVSLTTTLNRKLRRARGLA